MYSFRDTNVSALTCADSMSTRLKLDEVHEESRKYCASWHSAASVDPAPVDPTSVLHN